MVPIALVGSKDTLSQSIHSEKNLSFLNPFEDEAETSAPQCAESNHIKRTLCYNKLYFTYCMSVRHCFSLQVTAASMVFHWHHQ